MAQINRIAANTAPSGTKQRGHHADLSPAITAATICAGPMISAVEFRES